MQVFDEFVRVVAFSLGVIQIRCDRVLAVGTIRARAFPFKCFKVYFGFVFICAKNSGINVTPNFDAMIHVINIAFSAPDNFFPVNALKPRKITLAFAKLTIITMFSF